MDSQLAWLDHSDRQRRQMMEIVGLFREERERSGWHGHEAHEGLETRDGIDTTPARGTKYRALFDYLDGLGLDRWDASFDQIEEILDDDLPASARSHQAWWANNPNDHPHSWAWLAAGYRTSNPRLGSGLVTFTRSAGREDQRGS